MLDKIIVKVPIQWLDFSHVIKYGCSAGPFWSWQNLYRVRYFLTSFSLRYLVKLLPEVRMSKRKSHDVLAL